MKDWKHLVATDAAEVEMVNVDFEARRAEKAILEQQMRG